MLSADDMGGRGIDTEGSAKARAYIRGRFEQIGLTVVEQPFAFTRKRDGKEVHGVNLIARIDGTVAGGKAIVVGAHHVRTRDPGRRDLQRGRRQRLGRGRPSRSRKPSRRRRQKHSVILVALDGEESGLRGARLARARLFPLSDIQQRELRHAGQEREGRDLCLERISVPLA